MDHGGPEQERELQLPALVRGFKARPVLPAAHPLSLCSEFINTGTDTSSTSLQWIMANLVKEREYRYHRRGRRAREEDLGKLPRGGGHGGPPVAASGHFVLPHAATEDIAVGGPVPSGPRRRV